VAHYPKIGYYYAACSGCRDMIDVKCPICGEVYHADHTHLGKHLKCSRCGSVVPLLEPVRTIVVPSPRPTVAVRPPTTARSISKLARRVPVWVVASVIAVIVILSLTWYRTANQETVNGDELGSPANIIHRAPTTPDTRTPEPSSEYEVVEPAEAKVVAPTPPERALSRKQEPRPKFYESLPTGTSFCDFTQTTGKDILEIENGTTEDAALRLYDASTEQIVRCPFVKAHDSLRVTGIAERIYGLKYTSGLDWQADAEAFRWLPSYDRFDCQFVYSEKRIGDEIQYEIKVTLHPVIGGNVRNPSITRDEFLRGEHDASIQR
jgi:hypothetical protein